MISLADALLGAAIALGCAVAGLLLGAGAFSALRRRSLSTLVTVAGVVSQLTVAAAVAVAAAVMFLNGHDLAVALVVVGLSLVTGAAVAALLGRRMGQAGCDLAVAATTVGDGYRPPARQPPTAELAAVADSLTVADRRLVEARERERMLEDSRRQLVAWISHDLRTPLAGLRAMAEALEDGVVDDPGTVTRYHGQIRAEVDQLNDLVSDLFELSRVQGSLRLKPRKVGLPDLVEEALHSVDPLARAKGVRLAARAVPAVPIQVDPVELGRALRNLLTNAVRYTPADGSVEIVAAVEGDTASLEVADGCGGIPPEELPHVFDVAFRGQSARPKNDGGAGLGLAIAQGIVQAHDGHISVSNDGPGCRFVIRLPLVTG
ncbi:MAG: HAMP domain-containing histidine kinase [Acidothermales bacterium]|nr:HAMP domain-containing histidine kinase [Acidothermales bacterium]